MTDSGHVIDQQGELLILFFNKMAKNINVLRNLLQSHFGGFHMPQTSPAWALVCGRNNSNTASVTRIKRIIYPRMYPTLLVYPDGSTVNIRYKEPRRIIKLPLVFSSLSEAEKRRILASRKPKGKLEVIEDFGENIDLSEYSKFFKN